MGSEVDRGITEAGQVTAEVSNILSISDAKWCSRLGRKSNIFVEMKLKANIQLGRGNSNASSFYAVFETIKENEHANSVSIV